MKGKFVAAFLAASLAATAATEKIDFGGVLTVWPEDHGVFVFVNAQSAVERTKLEKAAAQFLDDFNIDVRLVDGTKEPFDIRKVPAELKGLGAKGGIWIVNDPKLPASIAAVEDSWGMVNVAPLTADAPDAGKLDVRIKRFLLRTFGTINGATDSPMMPGCVMKQAVGVRGVDALPCNEYSPEALGKITSYLDLAGYKTRKVGTYYNACEEGWAPPPTNEVQKAIWDKVHQLPTKPIRILPKSKQSKR